MAEATVKPWGETTVVGKPIPRVDGYERVSGTAVYPLDVILPNMLYAAILRCPHATCHGEEDRCGQGPEDAGRARGAHGRGPGSAGCRMVRGSVGLPAPLPAC